MVYRRKQCKIQIHLKVFELVNFNEDGVAELAEEAFKVHPTF
jgi:hypothetical protein